MNNVNNENREFRKLKHSQYVTPNKGTAGTTFGPQSRFGSVFVVVLKFTIFNIHIISIIIFPCQAKRETLMLNFLYESLGGKFIFS